MKYVDNFLNKITMYKTVLYGLLVITACAFVASFFGFIFYTPLDLLYSFVILFFICYITNFVISFTFNIAVNIESQYITALILFLILKPLSSLEELKVFLIAGVVSMASKYVLAIGKKHIFNPVAIALVITGLLGYGSAFWWVGSSVLLVPVAIVGFLVLRKTQRFTMFTAFAAAAVVSIIGMNLFRGFSVFEALTFAILSGPLLFFGAIMLTEPLTTPTKNKFRIIYGVFVGLLYGLQWKFGPVGSSPEMALVIGNLLSYALSPRARLVLTLVQKNALSKDVYDFVWKPDKKLVFRPGQYLEWTMPIYGGDSRGNRRYFTIASSPTEAHIHLGVKFYENPSSFKKKLLAMNEGETLVASQLSGEFILPEDRNKKLVFIAGGIGVTPFRSMAKYMFDMQDKRDAVMFYSNRTPKDIVYRDFFENCRNLGLNTIFVVNELEGEVVSRVLRQGFITPELIMKEVPDYKERAFYISGPRGMVTAFEKTLSELGVKKSNIHTDFFPGFV
ncbi:MAG: RnfABCDGE type electron transport complex subunit D [Patescibacteria group bacterium]